MDDGSRMQTTSGRGSEGRDRMSFEDQLSHCEGSLRTALGEVCVLQNEVEAGIEPQAAHKREARLAVTILQALAHLGIKASGVPERKRVAEALTWWPPKVRVIVSLLPQDGTGERAITPREMEPWQKH